MATPAGYRPYGGTVADFLVGTGDVGGVAVLVVTPGATVTLWDGQTGGAQITDILDVDGAAITGVTADDEGALPIFYVPEAVEQVWIDGGGARRRALPTDGSSVPYSAVTDKPSTFPPSPHSHPISDVTGLQAGLDGKSPVGHTHALDDLSDVATTGAVSGQFLGTDDGGVSWTPRTPAGAGTTPTTLGDLTDVQADSPTHGQVMVYDANAGAWVPGGIGNTVLGASEAIPDGTPPSLIWNLPLNVLLNHPIEGTDGATVDPVAEGFDSFFGTPVTYTSAQAAVGTTSVHVTAGNFGDFLDTGLGLTVAYIRAYFRFDPATGNIGFYEMESLTDVIASLQRQTDGTMRLKDSSGITTGTSSTTCANDTWYRIEWRVGGGTQTLRIYTLAGALQEELSGSAGNGAVDLIRHGLYANPNGGLYLDAMAVAESWIGAA